MSESNIVTGDNLTLENSRVIFVIDDDPIQTEMIKDYLKERYVFELKEYSDGESALEDLKKYKPEMIVLDYHLNSGNPKAKNGIEVLKEIKKNYPASKVIMFTGEDNINIASYLNIIWIACNLVICFNYRKTLF